MTTIVQGYKSTQEIIGADRTTALAVNEKEKTLCLIRLRPGLFGYSVEGHKSVTHLELVSAEVVEDGETITRTMRMSQIGGAIVGGALLGGVGALVGALTGKTSAKSKVHSLDLKITVNDLRRPVHTIRFLDRPCMRGDFEFQKAAKKAEHWSAVLAVLIKQADEENRQRPVEIQASKPEPPRIPPPGTRSQIHEAPPLLVADELSKLARLLEMGLLTREEFDDQKQVLLGKSKPAQKAPTSAFGVSKRAPERIPLPDRTDYSPASKNAISSPERLPLPDKTGRAQEEKSIKIDFVDLDDAARVRALLEQGADPNEPIVIDGEGGPSSATPLYWVVFFGMGDAPLEVVKLLVAHGADVNALCDESRALDWVDIAIEGEDKRIRDYLISKGAVLSY